VPVTRPTAPQLRAAQCAGIGAVISIQNKTDLVTPREAEQHHEEVRAFISGTAAATRGVTPICAQRGLNLGPICAQIAALPVPTRDATAPLRMLLIRYVVAHNILASME